MAWGALHTGCLLLVTVSHRTRTRPRGHSSLPGTPHLLAQGLSLLCRLVGENTTTADQCRREHLCTWATPPPPAPRGWKKKDKQLRGVLTFAEGVSARATNAGPCRWRLLTEQDTTALGSAGFPGNALASGSVVCHTVLRSRPGD